jgi:ATP-binding cassette subfamily B multidrug efflux pump
VKNAPIYIFDDSFSALDMKTDAALREALHRETGASTLLIVAQRVGTILTADQIVVLENGEVVGRGTHRELLSSCEVYHEIALSQLSEAELAQA